MKGAEADFHTYFNSFSCGKWRRYTAIDTVSLFLRLEGAVEISVFHNKFLYGMLIRKKLFQRTVMSDGQDMVEIPIGVPERIGDFSFCLHAVGEEVKFFEGYYGGTAAAGREVSLAVCITTYRREAYVKENLKRLCEIAGEKVHTYIVDNGNTLSLPASEKYTVLPNPNTGGAGGFARNMIQVMEDREKYRFSHFVLMDDDVALDHRVIIRLADFLRFIKEEHSKDFVGGAMLRRDIPYFHVESGAVRKGLEIQGYGYGMDMRDPVNFMLADMERKSDYNAWWFCAVPVSYARPDNLPLPIFFQWDDVDYGSRNRARVILLNGICTWHDPFDSKKTAMSSYYTTRNPMIVNACHGVKGEKKAVLRFLRKCFLTELYLYRYANAEAVLRGAEDFLRGPDWLEKLDCDAYNKELLAGNVKQYEFELPDYTWYQVCCGIEDCDRLHAVVRKLTFNGYLLPVKNDITVPCSSNRIVQGYRAAHILFYDEAAGKGYECQRDRGRALADFRRYRRVLRKLKFGYRRAAEEYRRAYPRLHSRGSWEGILGLNLKNIIREREM